MRRVLQAIAHVFAYFSILPVGRFAQERAPDAFALTFLPLAGAVLGALAGAAGLAVFAFHPTSIQLAYAVTFVLLLVLTGAIHVDGYLDSCDAFFAPVNAQRRLEIMKDVRHGTFAVAGMGVLVWLWWVALQRYTPSPTFVLTMAFACATARLAMIPNAWLFPYARGGEPTRQFEARPSRVGFAVMLLFVVALGYAIAPIDAVVALIAVGVGVCIGWWMSTKLNGGLTGDCYGFGVVVMEVLLLLSLPR